jgi:hypothetical protein
MFVEKDIIHNWLSYELIYDESSNLDYRFIGQDILTMLSTTAFYFVRQEVKSFLNIKNMKYNMFYSPSIGTMMYVPAFMCIDFHRIIDYNMPNQQCKILNEKAFDYNYKDKIRILIDRTNEKILALGDATFARISAEEDRRNKEIIAKMTEEEKRKNAATNKFLLIKDDLSNKLKDVLNEYGITLYYNYMEESTCIKFNDEELTVSIVELME